MSNTMNTHGGKREGAGRPFAGTKNVGIQITPEEHAKLQALGGSAWIRAKLAEVTLKKYAVDRAVSRADGPYERAVMDCYEDSFEFEAPSDADAVKYVERLQDKHDKKAAEVIEKARRDNASNAYALECAFDGAPCYTACLTRYDAEEDEWIRVES
ncbi:MAG: hypothetical protein SPH18_07210 [Sutterella parvirubra]|nr:hypothetical protein [Sutterella parvirubra]